MGFPTTGSDVNNAIISYFSNKIEEINCSIFESKKRQIRIDVINLTSTNPIEYDTIYGVGGQLENYNLVGVKYYYIGTTASSVTFVLKDINGNATGNNLVLAPTTHEAQILVFGNGENTIITNLHRITTQVTAPIQIELISIPK